MKITRQLRLDAVAADGTTQPTTKVTTITQAAHQQHPPELNKLGA